MLRYLVPEKVREYREKSPFRTQGTLATALGKTQQTIHRWETQPGIRVRIDDIEALASALKCRVDDITSVRVEKYAPLDEEALDLLEKTLIHIATMYRTYTEFLELLSGGFHEVNFASVRNEMARFLSSIIPTENNEPPRLRDLSKLSYLSSECVEKVTKEITIAYEALTEIKAVSIPDGLNPTLK
ncbi:MAG: helix-turn-helix transcriptional regulator [Candidatus Poribacteria bacterium]|nr:helix-turn-helix transcriptional regulator [Candidatus Poribacteria bacterium]